MPDRPLPPSPPPPNSPPPGAADTPVEKPPDLTRVLEHAAQALAPNAPEILVVEDTHVVRRILSYHLIKEGYCPVEARDGNEAIHMLGARKIEAILLDLALPHLDGLSMLRQIRQDPRFANIPVIVVTAKHDRSVVIQAAALGVTDYVVKPFEKSDILKRLARFVKPAERTQVTDPAKGERRKSRRIDVPPGLSWVRGKGKSKPPEDRSPVMNLTTEGCAFEFTPKSPPAASAKGSVAPDSVFHPFAESNPGGANLLILLEVPHKERPILDVGVRVAHVTRSADGTREIVGVKFVEIDKQAKATINKFLYDVRQEQVKAKRGTSAPGEELAGPERKG